VDWPGFEVHRISSEEIFLVCSPALCRGRNGLRTPQDLARQTIVRTTSPWILRDDWPLWLRKAGIGEIRFASEIKFFRWLLSAVGPTTGSSG
jgi:LysR family glycine cleavage system transcriptional activator